MTWVSGRGVAKSTFDLGGNMKTVHTRKILGSAVHFASMAIGAGVLAALAVVPAAAQAALTCAAGTISADVVVFDQPLMYNRLGAQNVNGIMYALRRDVVPLGCATGAASCAPGQPLLPGAVALRPDKRPRPLVLRVAAGGCLKVTFQNLLAPLANTTNPPAGFTLPPVNDQVANRWAGFHAQGMQLDTIGDDSSAVGANGISLYGPGGGTTYTFFAEKEGTFLVTSHGATFGGEGSAGNSGNGMFAVINVEPPGAKFYRSQVTEEEMRLCTTALTRPASPSSTTRRSTRPRTPTAHPPSGPRRARADCRC